MIVGESASQDDSDSYLTLAAPAESQLRDRGSRFIAAAFPSRNAAEFRHNLDSTREIYPGATHYCFAYRFGLPPHENRRLNDDGEPMGSAGPPIMQAIETRGLTNTVVIVVRYFGGTKLGYGGLVRAYGQAARQTLDDAKTVSRYLEKCVRIACGYDLFGAVNKRLEKLGCTVVDRTFDDRMKLDIRLRAGRIDALLQDMAELRHHGVEALLVEDHE